MAPQTTNGASEMASVLREALRMVNEKRSPETVEALMLPKVIESMGKVTDAVRDQILKQVGPEATTNEQKLFLTHVLEELREERKANRELTKSIMDKPEKTAGQDPMLTYVLDELRDERKSNREMMTELFRRKQPSEDEPRGVMKTAMEKLIEKAFESLDSGGGGSSRFEWRDMLPLAMERLSPGLNGLLGGLGFLMRRAAGGTATAPPPGPGQPPPENPAAIPQPEGDPANMMLAEIAGPLVQHLLDPEATGTDFALWFVRGNKQLNNTYSGGYGVRAHAEVVAMGKEKLLSMAKMFPPLWAQIEPVGGERINTFLDEFLAFDDEGYEPDDGLHEDDPPPEEANAGLRPVPPKRRAKKGEGA